jgi:methionyl-tRNA formyltransferase
MKVVFMGTPDFSVAALEAIVAAGHHVAAVYTQPPRPAGRGKKERPSAVQRRAEALGLPVLHPRTLRGDAAQAEFTALGADIAVVVAYGMILPRAILQAPARGCLNIHASLLPRWRGAAPIHRAIMAGDEKTGVCIMQMDEGLDTGPVLLRREVAIGDQDTTADLHDRLAGLGAGMIVDALSRLDDLAPMAQPESGVTYAAKIDKAEARIDWTRPAIEVDRLIRGLSPFPGAWCEVAGERVKLLGSHLADGAGAPGQVLRDFTVACGDGALTVTRAQRSGKRAVDARELLRGWSLPDRLD